MKAPILYRIASTGAGTTAHFFSSAAFRGWFTHLAFASPIPHGELIRFLAQCGQFTLTCRASTGHIGTSFVAAGFSVGVFYLFAAVLAWQLRGLPAETLPAMRVTVWALALCFAVITVVSWRYLFILPIVFSIVITVCLTSAAWLSAKPR